MFFHQQKELQNTKKMNLYQFKKTKAMMHWSELRKSESKLKCNWNLSTK